MKKILFMSRTIFEHLKNYIFVSFDSEKNDARFIDCETNIESSYEIEDAEFMEAVLKAKMMSEGYKKLFEDEQRKLALENKPAEKYEPLKFKAIMTTKRTLFCLSAIPSMRDMVREKARLEAMKKNRD